MVKMREGEKVIKEVRRHWFVMLGPLFASFVLAGIPLLVFSLLGHFSVELAEYVAFKGSIEALIAFVYSLWLLLILVFFAVQWTEYYLDVWYISNMRIIDVDQLGLFSRKTKTLDLNRIQDITVEVKGFIATMLEFGTIHVQTAGTNREILLHQSKDPYEVRRIILKAAEKRADQAHDNLSSDGVNS